MILSRWYDCDSCGEGGGSLNRPLGAGVITVSDTIGKIGVKRGLPIIIESETAIAESLGGE